jgi:hypothetical protein
METPAILPWPTFRFRLDAAVRSSRAPYLCIAVSVSSSDYPDEYAGMGLARGKKIQTLESAHYRHENT